MRGWVVIVGMIVLVVASASLVSHLSGEASASPEMLPTLAIVSICGGLKSMGNLTMCEMVNDPDWKEIDVQRMERGLLADSLCVIISGLLGGMASDTSASNVGLSRASGATSRFIGIAAGALFIVLGFSPKLAALLSIMPMPVMGAILVYVTCFMFMSGLQIIVGSRPDERRTFVIGISLIFGLSLAMIPQLYAEVPALTRPLLESPLTFATVLAVILNQLLSIGQPRETGMGSGHGHSRSPGLPPRSGPGHPGTASALSGT